MLYYIILLQDGSFKLYKNKHDIKKLPQDTRQFECSSNVTVQDLYNWVKKDFQGFRTIKEIEE
ncbi:MAG TPA: hypothetical protein PLV50_10800 [Smithella sp.]|nr:hypothetical protein [Smithella sp.]MDM7985830.1 hypothetical protein [Smithella sp.]HNY50812.1 hypothetical protein [Smithella sp.]HOG91019.1 hypothetical protein [Smithella sp.]HOU51156.1 hypothetical protein [Smithella sp.]